MFLAIRKSFRLQYQEPIEQIPLSQSMQETDELEETLSLCDLPLYSPANGESNGSNSFWTSDHDQDCFEFFSEELDFTFPPEKIVFCGKIITPRKPISEIQNPDENKQQSSRKWRLRQIFRWKTSLTHEDGQKNLQKVSVLTSSSSGKSRWYLFLFGITRFPTGMELRDMKNRQSRRRRDPLPPMFQFKTGDEKANHLETNVWSGVWGLIKALSCTGGSHQMNAVVPHR